MLRRTPRAWVVAWLLSCGPPARGLRRAARAADGGRQDLAARARRLLQPHSRRHHESSNDSAPVTCSEPHTSETFAIGTLPASTGKDYDAEDHGTWIYPRASAPSRSSSSVDESLAMRVQLSWAWFRASERGWDKGARWYRCDLLGGTPRRDAVRRAARDREGTVPGQAARAVAHLCPGHHRGQVGQAAVQRAARLAGRDHDQAGQPEGPLPRGPALGGALAGLLLRLGGGVAATTRSTTSSATRGSTRRSGRPATGARSAGRRPSNEPTYADR